MEEALFADDLVDLNEEDKVSQANEDKGFLDKGDKIFNEEDHQDGEGLGEVEAGTLKKEDFRVRTIQLVSKILEELGHILMAIFKHTIKVSLDNWMVLVLQDRTAKVFRVGCPFRVVWPLGKEEVLDKEDLARGFKGSRIKEGLDFKTTLCSMAMYRYPSTVGSKDNQILMQIS